MGILLHTLYPSIQEADAIQVDPYEFGTSLVYTASSRPAKAI